jgi:hypothetical protein
MIPTSTILMSCLPSQLILMPLTSLAICTPAQAIQSSKEPNSFSELIIGAIEFMFTKIQLLQRKAPKL